MTFGWRPSTIGIAFVVALGVVVGAVTGAAAQAFTFFPIPTANSTPTGITQGPDGNLWFTEFGSGKISRITPAGVISEFSVPTASSLPAGITAGPDGNLWFVEAAGNKIGRVTTAGIITEFTIPTAGSFLERITAGPDGNLWFTERETSTIARITPAGVIIEFPVVNSAPIDITAGPDGNLWFTEDTGNKIGRITPAGVITEFAVPQANGEPGGITAGPDGNLWFTDQANNLIGKISPTVTVSVAADHASFTTGDALVSSVSVSNPAVGGTTDFYFGALLPDGDTVVCFTDFAFHSAVGSLSHPATLRPIAAGVDLTTTFTFSNPSFFIYHWTGAEPAGTYTLFLAAVKPGAFVDNVINAGDIVSLSTAPVTFSP